MMVITMMSFPCPASSISTMIRTIYDYRSQFHACSSRLSYARTMRGQDPWASEDPLGEALHFLRMTGAFYCRSELSEPWGLAMPEMQDCLWFHVVTSGRCRIEVHGDEISRPW